jgi:Xaa-Pro dipeptidase
MGLMDRRAFMAAAGASAGAAMVPGYVQAQDAALELRPITGGAVPIGRAERQARIARAQRLMRSQGLSAILIEPGASLVYFTGVRWSRSERLTGAVIPAEGKIGCSPLSSKSPPFARASPCRPTFAPGTNMRIRWRWSGRWLKERKLGSGAIGVEETVRYFAVDGLQRALPGARIRSAAPVVRAVRMIKSPAEIALMQLAADVTIAAYRHTYRRIERGMTPAEIGAMMNQATSALGGRPEFALVLLGEASAYPHGTGKPQQVKEGEVVLMDCGCTVQGYQSDISRTFVFGEPTKRSGRCGTTCIAASRSRSRRRGSACPQARSTMPCALITRSSATAPITSSPASPTAPATASAWKVTSP